jgi:hypothetical protein
MNKLNEQLLRVKELMKRLSFNILGIDMEVIVEHDKKSKSFMEWLQKESRIYIQLAYRAPDTKELDFKNFKGGKWYLSEHMTDDEIVKKAYLAFRTCVEHEVLEGFKVDNVVIFNPHRNFEDLVKLGDNPEIVRNPMSQEEPITFPEIDDD